MATYDTLKQLRTGYSPVGFPPLVLELAATRPPTPRPAAAAFTPKKAAACRRSGASSAGMFWKRPIVAGERFLLRQLEDGPQ